MVSMDIVKLDDGLSYFTDVCPISAMLRGLLFSWYPDIINIYRFLQLKAGLNRLHIKNTLNSKLN